MCDWRLALQHLRSNANTYDIDKSRIGAHGHSAGGGTSLWLAFHNDIHNPTSTDPVLQESTRLTVVGARAVQATYNPSRWRGRHPSLPQAERRRTDPVAERVQSACRSLPGCGGKHHLSSQTLPGVVSSVSSSPGRTSTSRAYHCWFGEPSDSTSAIAPFGNKHNEVILISSFRARIAWR